MNKVLIIATVKVVVDADVCGEHASALTDLLTEQILSRYELSRLELEGKPVKEIDEEGVWL